MAASVGGGKTVSWRNCTIPPQSHPARRRALSFIQFDAQTGKSCLHKHSMRLTSKLPNVLKLYKPYTYMSSNSTSMLTSKLLKARQLYTYTYVIKLHGVTLRCPCTGSNSCKLLRTSSCVLSRKPLACCSGPDLSNQIYILVLFPPHASLTLASGRTATASPRQLRRSRRT